VGTRCADHVTPLYPQKLALTSPTGGGRSVGIVRVRTKTTEYLTKFFLFIHMSGFRHFKGKIFLNIFFLSTLLDPKIGAPGGRTST